MSDIGAENHPPERLKKGRFRVLVVEDEPLGRELLKQVLEEKDVEAVFAESGTGEEGLNISKKEKETTGPFDIVITDQGLAGKLNGIGFAENLKKEGFASTIVIFTADPVTINYAYNKKQLEERGVYGVFGKTGEGFRDLKELIDQQKQAQRSHHRPQS